MTDNAQGRKSNSKQVTISSRSGRRRLGPVIAVQPIPGQEPIPSHAALLFPAVLAVRRQLSLYQAGVGAKGARSLFIFARPDRRSFQLPSDSVLLPDSIAAAGVIAAPGFGAGS